MVGAGIFALPGTVAHFAGSWTPLVILAVGLALLPVVLVFAGLAALFEDTGGPVLYVDAAFGRTAAFQTGWMQCLSTAASSAANANLLADYALRLAPASQSGPFAHAAVVLATTGLVLAINLVDARGSSAWLRRISVAKLLPLALLVLLALPAIGGASLRPAGEWSLAQAVLLSVYAFTGFEGGLSVAGEARDPKHDFPRALVSVFAAIACLYALLASGYVATAYVPGLTDKAPLATMAAMLLGVAGTIAIIVTAALSIFGNVAANTLSVSRRLLALEEMGTIPRWFGVIRADTGLPRNAVIATYLAITLLALSGGFVWLAVLSVAARLTIYVACSAALPVIQRKRGLRQSASGMVIVAVAIATCLALISQSEARAWAGLAITVAVGFVVKYVAALGVSRRRT